MRLWPRSLFGRTAMLIAGTLLLYSIIAWQVIVWSVVEPASALTVQILKQRAEAALAVRGTARPAPAETRFETAAPDDVARPLFHGLAYGAYVERIRENLQKELHAPDVRVGRLAAPSEIWVRMPEAPDAWLVLTWHLAGPKAPIAALSVLAAGALIVLVGAALSARRLTAPLAGLAAAAARLAEGHRVPIVPSTGPSEVRALSVAFQSMSHRLAELDEQRELMLGGISHDLRTPLARIRVAVELLETRDAALIGEMTSSIEEMDGMIGRFLHYVRANYREPPGVGSPDAVVREALASYAGDSNLILDLHAGETCRFAIDCVRHTVINLVGNAFEYGEGSVSVRTAATGPELTLSVSDHGRGLTAAEWEDAVKPFHRLNGRVGAGHSGLGLALVERLVRTCGGSLICGRQDGAFTIVARIPAYRVAADAGVSQS